MAKRRQDTSHKRGRQPAEDDAIALKWKQCQERWKTVRAGFICLSIIAGICAVGHYGVKLAAVLHETTWYSELFHLLGIIASSLLLPSLVIRKLLKMYRRHVERVSSHVQELESELDPMRLSSDLRPDGSSDHD